MHKSVKRKTENEIEKVEDELKKRRLLRTDWTIHAARCAADPLYRLFLFPNSEHIDERGEQTTFVDTCVHYAIQILEKRYGSTIKDDRAINHIFNLLQNTRDPDPKIFFVLCILNWESQPFADEFEEMYSNELGKGLFENLGKSRFRQFMNFRIKNFVEIAMSCAYTKFNIAHIVRRFVADATKEYFTGHLELTTQSNPL